MKFTLMLILVIASMVYGATLFSNGGAWNTASNWGTTSGASDGTVPGVGDSAILDNNTISNVTLSSDVRVRSVFVDSSCTIQLQQLGYKVTCDSIFEYHTSGGNGLNDTVAIGKLFDSRSNLGDECSTFVQDLGYTTQQCTIRIIDGFLAGLVLGGTKAYWDGLDDITCGIRYLSGDTLFLSGDHLMIRAIESGVLIDSGSYIQCSYWNTRIENTGALEDTVISTFENCTIEHTGGGAAVYIRNRHGHGHLKINQTGELNIIGDTKIYGFAYQTGDKFSWYTNGNRITSNGLSLGTVIDNSDYRVYCDSSIFDITNLDMVTYSASSDAIIYMDSSTWTVSGDVSLHTNNSMDWGTSLFTIDATSNVTSNNESFGSVTASGPITLIDSMKCDSLRVQSTFNSNSNRLNAGWARFSQPESTLTLSAMSTIGGDSVIISESQVATITACTLVVDNTAVIQTPGRTFARGIFNTDGATYTWTAGDTVTFSSVSKDDHSGSASGDVTFNSTTPGTPYYLSIPAGDTATYWNVTDLWNIGETVYAKDATNTDGGNNDGIRFTPIISSTLEDTIEQGQTLNIIGSSFSKDRGTGDAFVADDELSGVSWGDTQISGSVSINTESDSLHDVSVITEYGDTASLEDAVYIKATVETLVVIDNITPNSASPLGIDTLTITGEGFQNSGDVYYGGSTVTEITRNNTQIICLTNTQTQGDTVDVIVTNAQGFADTSENAVRIHYMPVLYCLDTIEGSTGDELTVFCANAYNTMGSGSINFGDTTTSNYVEWTDDSVTLIVPKAQSGTYDIILTNSDDEKDTLVDAFTHNGGSLPLTIVNHPQDDTVFISDSVTFNVVAVHDSIITYQWQEYNSGWVNIVGATDSVYTTSELTYEESNDSFRVIISVTSVDTTDTSNSAKVIVQYRSATIIDDISSDTVQEQDTLILTFTASGDSLDTLWQIDSSGVWETMPNESLATLQYYVEDTLKDGFRFRAIVNNVESNDTTSISVLTVNPAPYYVNEFTVNPDYGTPAGGTRVGVGTTGNWFIIGGLTVTVDGRSGTSVTRINDDSLTFVTPIGLVGLRSITITNSDSESMTMNSIFNYKCTPIRRRPWIFR